jgi:DHA1 family bicyclomycin/chloramphenicol resistance-like MFS transporter
MQTPPIAAFTANRYRAVMIRLFNSKPLPLIEFIPLVALVTALDALSIDTIIPALPAIGAELGVAQGNDLQLLISLLFAGFAIGQLLAGPMADSWGRKPTIFCGLAIYIAGSLLGMTAQSFSVLLVARVMQGIGASMPFTGFNALVRDLHEGAPMARIMSFVGVVFILVPMLAPMAGQGILMIAGWREIFLLYLALAVPAAVWFGLRQPETLAPDKRVPFAARQFVAGVAAVFHIRQAAGYIICGGFLTGSFFAYLNTAQQMFQQTYGLGKAFVFYFSTLAFSIGLSLLINGTLVGRIGMRRLTASALAAIAAVAALFLPLVIAMDGVPPLWITMAYLLVTFLCVGITFGNLNALAMEPLGHIAGVGAAATGFVSSMMGAILGGLVGRAYDGGVTALVSGFALLNILALAAMWWGERVRR